ncbi:uncharacterized protein LOC144923885 [Branchiostoma floridae x Branchiostoma belcheri]
MTSQIPRLPAPGVQNVRPQLHLQGQQGNPPVQQVGQQAAQQQAGQPQVPQPVQQQPGNPQVGQQQAGVQQPVQQQPGNPQVGQQQAGVQQPVQQQPGNPQVGQQQAGVQQPVQQQPGNPQVGQQQAGVQQPVQQQPGNPQVGQQQAGIPQAGQCPGGQAIPQDLDTMRREFQALKEEVNKMKGDSVEGIKEELIQLASRPSAAFDARRAVGLLETLSVRAKHQNHPKADEFSAILLQLRPLSDRDFFKDIILDILGSPVIKQINKSIAGFIKSHKHLSNTPDEGAGPSRQRRGSYRPRPYGRGGRFKSRQPLPTDECNHCGEKGHWARTCTNPPKKY